MLAQELSTLKTYSRASIAEIINKLNFSEHSMTKTKPDYPMQILHPKKPPIQYA